MASLVSKMRLKVSPLTGIAYITTVLKNGWCGEQRKELDKNEVYNFMINYIDANLEEDENTLFIQEDKKTILKIRIYRENIK